MEEQLVLVDSGTIVHRLDQRTREIGLRGVAEARRVLLDTIAAAAERAAGEEGAAAA